MNAFLAKVKEVNKKVGYRKKIEVLQVNMGNLCNQRCAHCHVNAGPDGRNVMNKETMAGILNFLSKEKSLTLDLTGGAPEMNPDFEYMVRSARSLVKEIIVRSNLTVLSGKGKGYIPDFFKENKVHLICSLPCYTKENVDAQRGGGVFEKSIEALKTLNDKGYGKEEGLVLDLVYNPGGAFLPGSQEGLEGDYRERLRKEHVVEFNNLITIINAPINRFKEQLEASNEYDSYMELLLENFNQKNVENIMCRTLLSVGWDGALYDCDFNQAMGMALEDPSGKTLNIKDVQPDDLIGKGILFEDHCFSCTAGSGSSCQGALDRP
ncbi:arsenosugar biosynthesis radical SAM (seleno)protein ArsS [Candidatus Omnitrophota bacterium]